MRRGIGEVHKFLNKVSNSNNCNTQPMLDRALDLDVDLEKPWVALHSIIKMTVSNKARHNPSMSLWERGHSHSVRLGSMEVAKSRSIRK